MGIDKIVGWLCLIAGGFAIGQLYPSAVPPKVLPCAQPKKAVMYESRGDVKYWRDYTKGLPK